MALTDKHCVPCEGGISPLSDNNENQHLEKIQGWEIDRTTMHVIKRTFIFKSFSNAIQFVNDVASIAEKEDHHPDIHISFRKVTIELYTHAIGGLSENDFIVAAKINAVL